MEIPHFLHTNGTMHCGKKPVHTSVFSKVLLQLKHYTEANAYGLEATCIFLVTWISFGHSVSVLARWPLTDSK